MPEQTQNNAVPGADTPPRPPVPDLGFFAGAPTAGGGSSSFGGSSQFGSSSFGGGAPFGGPVAGAPAMSTFGTPVAAPFGSVGAPAGTPALPRQTGSGAGWKVAGGAAAVLVLVALVFGGRFGWQQFVADPVAPDTLMGMPRIADASDEEIKNAQDGLTDELSSGSAAEVALYSDGQGTGYMLFAVRGGSRPGSGSSDDPFSSWTKTEQNGTACYSKPAQAQAGLGVTMCMHGFWRRGVVVMGMGLTPPDPAVVAQATDEAWAAQ